jgi:DNA-binding NtrC family response regulator
LCSDQIHTVPLCEQLADSPGDLNSLLQFIAHRVAGNESDSLAKESAQWISKHLGDYKWPGNIRELEQCVRNVMIRGQYWPRRSDELSQSENSTRQWLSDAESCRSSADDLLAHYCAWVYARLGSYDATARALGIDRRTVKNKVDRVKSQSSIERKM